MATIKDGKGTLALAAFDTQAILQKHEFGRPEPGPNDVKVDIKYCGMCHSDLHACNGDWSLPFYPLTPGHEMAGIVSMVGSDVTTFKVGDRVGVGNFIDSCSVCTQCLNGDQNYCLKQQQAYTTVYTTGLGHDDCAGYHTNGGYSSQITVRSTFVYHAPKNLDLAYLGPLLCAGITMFSPLNRHVLKQGGKRVVGIIGFGGLGQIGVKIAKAMGADVTVFSRSDIKRAAAAQFGAKLVAHTDDEAMKSIANTFDVIIDTVSVAHDVAKFLPTLKVSSTYVCIGGVTSSMNVTPLGLYFRNLRMEGFLVGGVPETQQMLDFCYKHDIKPEIKVIHAKDANAQFVALANGDADIYRAVIDMSTLPELFLPTCKQAE
jgi:alcohol dehydrogenase (NADP+)